jgi:hypothetical protein
MPHNLSPKRPMAFLVAAASWLAALAACAPESSEPLPPQTAAQAPAEQARPSSASLLVRFQDPHPLAHAQALEAAGRCPEAEQLARETLATRADLAGLCFERFTAGGAEIVLAACAPTSDGQAFQQGWIVRLQAMEDVEYAEANVIAQPENCPPSL